MKKIYLFFCLFFMGSMMIFTLSCSTKKNTFTRRTYHNLTSHYNVYWNGMDNLRTGLKEYTASIKDNYAMVLPVFNYGQKSSSGKISQYADIGIQKASKAIQKHSMEFNRKEYVKWIDDAYLLIGKSYFFKQEYGMARRTFEFVIKNYNDNDIKYQAMLWLAKTNIQAENFKQSEPLLDMLQNKIRQGEAPEKYTTELVLTYAQFFILQENYKAAIPYLERAIELNPGRLLKTRCYFILGQINQQDGEYAKASGYYHTVVKRNPPFDMEFNAKINLAQCYDTKSGDKTFIVKKLNKMLKDEKNKDFQDQIYYALAQISLRDSDTITGIDFLVKSVAASHTNNYQKAISSLQLADIQFAIPDYTLAQAYYDSTIQFLPADFPNFKQIKEKTNTLTELVTNLQIIQREDSLQKLAGMAENDRNTVIDKIINQLIEEEQKAQREEYARLDNMNMFGQSRDVSGGTGAEGKWYFYNPTALSTGYSTFTRKWGRRTLEDNWFLSDKMLTAIASTPDEEAEDFEGDTIKSSKAGDSLNPKKREFYLKDLPLSPERIEISNSQLIHAYYNAGFIYIDGLKDYGNSIQSFETLLERFPDNPLKIETAYELYLLYTALKNDPKSDFYRNRILTEYPETDYARLLINPDYYKEMKQKESEILELYEDTYEAFSNEQYYMVIHNAGLAKASYPLDSIVLPKFEYLRALSLGKIEIVDSLVVALQNLIKKYPKNEVKPLAVNILSYLNTQRNAQGEPLIPDSSVTQEPEVKIYTYFPNSIHFFVLIVDGTRVDVNALKVKIADFNSKFYNLNNLQVNSLLLNNTQEMITINNFENAQKAIDYYNFIRQNEYVYTKLQNTGGYDHFVISVENYPVFYRNKNIDQYLRFFQKNYNPE